MTTVKITKASALRELQYILTSAYRVNGLQAFNGITMSGAWYAADDEQARDLIETLDGYIADEESTRAETTERPVKNQAVIEFLMDLEMDVACLLDDPDASEFDIMAIQTKVAEALENFKSNS